MAEKVVVIDNGGATCKVGFGGDKAPAKLLPNYIARAKGIKKAFIADQIEDCDDIQGLSFRRPIDRGYVVNWDAQREIWDRAFNVHLKVKPTERSLLLTEPPFTLAAIQKATDEVVFEEYGFRSYCTVAPAVLSHMHQAQQQPRSLLARSGCSLVLDAGFSFTHAVPVFEGRVIGRGVRRINLGGKALTNHLKELVSYRAWNMMDETFLMEDVKESLCLTSMDVMRDLSIARKHGPENIFRAEYVLPDGVRSRRGSVKDSAVARAALLKAQQELEAAKGGTSGTNQGAPGGRPQTAEEKTKGTRQAGDFNTGGGSGSAGGLVGQKRKGDEKATEQQELTLTNERFMVPEMLFHPADLGVNQAGLAECIVQSVTACPPELHPLLYSNILPVGGSTMFPLFRERLEMELRPLVPDEYSVHIHSPKDPILCTWRGGSLYAKTTEFKGRVVTKKEYEEYGSSICRKRFVQ